MKDFFSKEWVAWTVLGICVVFAVIVGINRRPEGLIYDPAGALSKKTESKLAEYNDKWEDKYDTRLAVMVISKEFDDEDEYDDLAEDRLDELDFEENDALLLMSVASGYYNLYPGENFYKLLTYPDFRKMTYAYMDEALGSVASQDRDETQEAVEEALLGYFHEIDNDWFKEGYVPDDIEEYTGMSAWQEGLNNFEEGIGALAGGAVNLGGKIVGGVFRLAGNVLKWIAGLGVFGIILVIFVLSKIFGNKKH